MLIATLPPVYREELFREIVAHPDVDAVRYNVGMVSPWEPERTLAFARSLANRYGKTLWIDIKGRQLRVTRWALPDYGCIRLNHPVTVRGEAEVIFRGGHRSRVVESVGDAIYVDPPPPEAVGEGQSVVIIGDDVSVDGYLTETDRAYIAAARALGIPDFMLSFVESGDDIGEFAALAGDDCGLLLKIESPRGLSYISDIAKLPERTSLVAARDDLFVAVGEGAEIIVALEKIVAVDPGAVVASRIFAGIEARGSPQLADYSDVALMHRMGYRRFMLSDGICHRHFRAAMNAWRSSLRSFARA